MTTITLRGVKGSPLTNNEVDDNFNNLNTYKVEQTSATGAAALPTGTTAQRPASPVAGNIRYNASTGKFEGYGSAWGNIGGGAAIGDTAPSNPGAGDLWWNSLDGHLYVYYSDGDTSQWVDAFAGGQGQYLPLTGGTISGNLYATGNVGIGTSAPGYKLEVAYGSTSDALVITGSVDNITPYLSFKASNGGASYIRGRVRGTAPDSTNGGLAFDTGASGSMSEKMRLDSSGNLGLGVTPSAWTSFNAFQIGGPYGALFASTASSGSNIGLSANANYNSGWKYINSQVATKYEQYAGQHQWYTAPSGTAGNAISFTQAMTLDASGKLLVGTTTAVSGYTIAIGDGTGPSGIYAKCNGAGAVYAGVAVGQESNGFYIGHLSATNQLQMRCGSTGGVYLSFGATSWAALSDVRLKTDLKPIKNATQKVSTLRAVTGRYKTDDEGVSRSFLIAQDVQSVFPEAVNAENPEELGVRYTDTIPLLVKAIQELFAELNELKQKVNA